MRKNTLKNIILCTLLFVPFLALAQNTYTIKGHFPNFPNSKYELKGYEGFQQTTIAKANSQADGKFTLSYPKNYVGVAQLWMNGSYSNLVFLNKENSTLYWEDLTKRDDMKSSSEDYTAFIGGMKAFQESEAKLAGLHYLLPLYRQDSLKQQWLTMELNTTANTFPTYIKQLDEHLFARQYLLTKGLLEQMPKTVETYIWRAPAHVSEFMAIDFKALKHAGLYNDIINGYTNLVERFPLEEVYTLLTAAIDKVATELQDEPIILQELAQYWFTLLEKKSLFSAAEHLALVILHNEKCTLDDKTQSMFEQYRTLANGAIAPSIRLSVDSTLLDLPFDYKLIVFGASWCPNCQTDYRILVQEYPGWKQKYNLEIIYVSVDTAQVDAKYYYNDAPFRVLCDGKGWDTPAAKDYHIFATPTYLLVDKNLKILQKIQNPDHLQSWFDRLVTQE